jgi:hypothetical protein
MLNFRQKTGNWKMGIGDWGLGPIPNPQSPIPNHNLQILLLIFNTFLKISHNF